MAVSGPSASDSSHEITLPGAGSTLGRYRVLRRLGAGGMGQVFAAEQIDRRELVALKQIGVNDPTLLVRFKQEFRSLADLPHPNLVRLGELVVLSSALAFYTMELIQGPSLIRWIRRGTPAGTVPNIARLCHAMRQLAAGVAHLHRAARIHRDLKPSNVLVTHEGRVVILDFGLVLELGERDARITATGQLVGTPAYMAPEQGTREAIGPAVDLYAIGVVLFECLTGCMPFVGPAIRVLLDKQTEPAPDPRELAEGIPDWLARLCRALLDARPEQRPSAEQLIATLDEHVPAAITAAALDDGQGPELIGRARELATLEQAFERVGLEGQATLVRVSGPVGRGKTALVDRFLDDVRGPASVILRGRCHPRESVPYKGIDRIVDELAVLLRSFDAVEAAALRPRHVRELCELFPVLAGIWSEAGRRSVDQDPIARRRLGIGALREVLTRLGDEATLVLVIDDVQWADLDGFAVLGELLLPPEPPVMLVVLSFDRDAGGPIIAKLAEPDALQGARAVDLELLPLSQADARSLAEALIDARLVDDVPMVAEQLARDSHGEPLALVRAATVLTHHGPVDVSELADDEVLRRILALSHLGRELLELACIAGERLANNLARAVLGCDVEPFDTALRELVAAGMISPLALESDGVIKLARPRIGALVEVESDAARQARLHVGLAEVLAANEAEPELIAAHFEAGGVLDRAREYVTRAAGNAAEALAFVRAEQLVRRALELCERGGGDGEARALRLALADQLVNLARSPEAAELYLAVANDSSPDVAAKLRLRAAEQYAISGWSQLALPLLQDLMREAGERLPGSTFGALLVFVTDWIQLVVRSPKLRVAPPQDLSAELLARFDLVYATQMAVSRKEMLLSFALRPRTKLLALMAGELKRLIAVSMLECGLLITLGDFDRAAALLRQADDWVRDCEDPLSRAYVHSSWHSYHARLGQLDQAEARLTATMDCFEQCSSRGWIQGPVLHVHSLSLRQTGAYRRLLASLPGWLSMLYDFGQRQHAALIHGEEVMALAQTGQCEAARRSLERGRASWTVEYYSFATYLLDVAETWLLMAEGRWADAHAHARRNEVEQRRHGHARFKLPRARVRETRLWAQLLHAIAEQDLALAPRQRELRRQRRCGVPQASAAALILLAGRAALMGDHAHAQQLWREALAACEALSMRGYAAALRWRLADAEPDPAVATELRDHARAYFEAEHIDDIDRFVALMAPAGAPVGR